MSQVQSQASVRNMLLTRRIIFVAVAAAVIIPYIVKLKLPGEPNAMTERVYNRIEDMKVQPGKPRPHVLLSYNYAPSSMPELYPMCRAVLTHCFKKGVIPVLMTLDPNALILMRMSVQESAAEAKKLYNKDVQSGRDYVILGFRPGGSMLLINMGENIKSAFDTDIDEQPTQQMPALQGLNSLRNLDLAIDFASSGTTQMWIAYGSDKFGFPLAAGTTAVQAPDLYMYVPSGQLKGFLGGLRGAADYETLLCRADHREVEGAANKGMAPQSAVHVMLVLLILGANVWMFYGKYAGKRKAR